jgi:salicylate hydroxylase
MISLTNSGWKVLCYPDPATSEESWTTKASKQSILDQFGSWDPHYLQKLIDLIPDDNVLVWHLYQHEPLPTWVMGKVVLLGDACHPMLPYVAQGAAQAVEDVAVLHLALDRISTKDHLPIVLKAYELARKPRAEHIMSVAGNNRIVLHLPDGPEQQERDRKFKAVTEGSENPDLLGDVKVQKFLWDHDPEKAFLDVAEGKFTLVL